MHDYDIRTDRADVSRPSIPVVNLRRCVDEHLKHEEALIDELTSVNDQMKVLRGQLENSIARCNELEAELNSAKDRCSDLQSANHQHWTLQDSLAAYNKRLVVRSGVLFFLAFGGWFLVGWLFYYVLGVGSNG